MNREAADEEPAQPLFGAGDVIAARWRVERFLARGGMGEVYEATDLELGGVVALKTLLAARAESERAVDRFRREVRLARRVTHPNVARVFDVARHEHGERTLVIYTMELLRGESLSDRVRRCGALPPREVAAIAHDAALGLFAAHEARVLHRDFKSSNVMLTAGPPARAVVTDFGLARTLDADVHGDASLSRDVPVLGTPAYMAPEQVEGGDVGVGADIYALGVVLFELLTGQLPFSGSSPMAIAVARLMTAAPLPSWRMAGLDARWDELVSRCLARRPEERFASMQDVAGVLASLRSDDASVLTARTEEGAHPLAPTLTLEPALSPAASPAAVQPKDSLAGSSALARVRTTRRALLALLTTSALAVGAYYALGDRLQPVALPKGRNPALLVLSLAPLEQADTREPTEALLAMLHDELSASRGLIMESTDALVDPPRDVKRLHALLDTDFVADVAPVTSRSEVVEVKLYEASTGRVARTFRAPFSLASARDAIEDCAAQLREALALGDPSPDALRAARAALPGSGEAITRYLEGKDLIRHFDAARAEPVLARAVALEPEFSLAHAARARALADLGRGNDAVASAKRAVETSGSLPRELALEVEAFAHEASLAWDKAATVYRTLYAFYPDDRQHAIDLARSLVYSGKPRDAWEVLAELIARTPAAADDPRVLLGQAEAANSTGDHKAQLPIAEKARDLARAAGARALEARAILNVANARVKVESARASLADYEAAEALYGELHIAGGAAKAAVLAAWAYALSDETDAALAAAERALDISRKGGDRRLEAIAVVQTGFVLHKRDPALARERYLQGLATLRELNSILNVTWVLGHLATLDVRQGKLADARARQEERASLARGARSREDEATAWMAVASIASKAGELEAATRAIDAALPTLVDLGYTERQGNLLVTRADVHIERTEFELALDVLGQAEKRFASAQSPDGVRAVQSRRAELAQRMGDSARAAALFARDIEDCRRAMDPAGAAFSALSLAEVALSLDQTPRLQEVTDALRVLEAQSSLHGVAYGESVLARVMLRAGDRLHALESARAALAHARPLEARIYRMRAIANAAHVLQALGRGSEAIEAVTPALSEANRLGLLLSARRLKSALR
jgi:hypothetical protein